MPKVADRVKETSITTGTGTYSLAGAATGFRAFSSAFATGDTVYYCVEDGVDWEVGIGTLTSGTPWTMARTTILGSSNSGSAVSWAAGTRNVYCTFPAAQAAVAITKNAIINGGMMVGQRGDLTLGSSAPAANAGYGKVDRWQAWATGTAVSAGTATQITNANCGRTGYALKLSGVTLTGTGIVFTRHRIEARNSLRFKNQTASFSIRVYHDVGSAINYTVTVRKANTADTFSATTVIQTGSATSVASATETLLKLENVSMGDCSNGIEIEVKAECGAITTKNFQYAEAQLEEGTTATGFEYSDFNTEFQKCLRYFEANSNQYRVTSCYNTNRTEGSVPFTVEKRVSPTVASTSTNWSYWYQTATPTSISSSSVILQINNQSFDIYTASISCTAGHSMLWQIGWTASAEL